MLECLAIEVEALDPRSRAAQHNELSKCATKILGTLVGVIDACSSGSTHSRIAAKATAAWLQLTTDAAASSLLSIGAPAPSLFHVMLGVAPHDANR